jgi:hypothetical protein
MANPLLKANLRFQAFNAYLPFTGGVLTHKLRRFTGLQDVPESSISDRPEENVVIESYSVLWAHSHPNVIYSWDDARRQDARARPMNPFINQGADCLAVTEINDIAMSGGWSVERETRLKEWLQGFSEANIEPDIDRIARFAIGHSNHQLLQCLETRQKPNLFQTDIVGRTALFYTSLNRTRVVNLDKMCRDLDSSLGIKKQIDHRDVLGASPLHYAAAQALKDHMEFYLSMGAEPDASTNAGETVMDILLQKRNSITEADVWTAFKRREGVNLLLQRYIISRRYPGFPVYGAAYYRSPDDVFVHYFLDKLERLADPFQNLLRAIDIDDGTQVLEILYWIHIPWTNVSFTLIRENHPGQVSSTLGSHALGKCSWTSQLVRPYVLRRQLTAWKKQP